MGRKEAWIHTNTTMSLQEVCDWLGSQSGWIAESDNRVGHRRLCQTVDGAVMVSLTDIGNHRPGSAAIFSEQLGSPGSISFDLAIGRDYKLVGRLDDVYQVAFDFAKHDPCSIRFTLDDANYGVFLRRDGCVYVNPEEFQANSLAAFLPERFEVVNNELEIP